MTEKTLSSIVPKEIALVSDTLLKAGFDAYLVGGCVRDILLGLDPKDWDLATNALPEDVEHLFEHTFYENAFGTVGIVFDAPSIPTVERVEVTTYRTEHGYSDNRRPDEVKFSDSIEEDLKRRDFTINAIAIGLPLGIKDISKGHTVDPHGGTRDLDKRLIRAVGDPHERFEEDALRMLRAIRLSSELGFSIDVSTETSIKRFSRNIATIATERIRDEFMRVIMSPSPMRGIEISEKLGLLEVFLPELREGIGIEQGGVHTFDVWEHSLRALQTAADKGWSLDVRLAALFHDIGKPRSRRSKVTGKSWSFYGHEVIGAKMTKEILTRLKFPVKLVEKVVSLVRWHMFFSDTEVITHSAVRRLIRNVGTENVWDLINLRISDRKGMGRPKEEPYRLRKYQALIEEVQHDPVSLGMLAIDGSRIMAVTCETPGPRIGLMLYALLGEVLDDPRKNTTEYLESRAIELKNVSQETLVAIGERGKLEKEERTETDIKDIRKRRGVE